MRARNVPKCKVCACGLHAFANTSRWGVTLVDAADQHWLRNYVWTLTQPRKGKFYARSEKLARVSGSAGYLHRAILSLPASTMADHIDANGLDNRRTNLRPACGNENVVSSRGFRRRASRYKGVHLNASGKGPRWKAAIKTAGVQRHLGYFDAEEDAARAYDAAAADVHGAFAHLNFPSTPTPRELHFFGEERTSS